MEILLVIALVICLFIILQIVRIRVSGSEVNESSPDIEISTHKSGINEKSVELQ